MTNFFNWLYLGGSNQYPQSGSSQDVNLNEFLVVEPKDFRSYQVKSCNLEKDHTGRYYLKPVSVEYYQNEPLFSSETEELDDSGMPSIEGWPASAKTEEEYWKLVDAYPGACCMHSTSYVSNLLNDVELNVPHPSASVAASSGKQYPISNQVVADIRRCNQINVNGETVYSLNNDSDAVEVFIREFSAAEKAVVTFKDCMDALENNYHLTSNALKLSTQATMGRLCILIMRRFFNLHLHLGIRCRTQKVMIDTRFQGITTIKYEAIWGIYNMDSLKDPCIKFLKSIVEIVIATEDLEKGCAGDAIAYEKCSRFFKTSQEAECCDLNSLLWPSGAESDEEYEKMLIQCSGYVETPPLLTSKSLFYGLKNNSVKSASDENVAFSLFSDLRSLRQLRINNQTVYGTMDVDDPRPVKEKGEALMVRCLEAFDHRADFAKQCLSFMMNSIVEHMTMLCMSRYSNIGLNRHISCQWYDMAFTESKQSKDLSFSVSAMWAVHDVSSDQSKPLHFLNLSVDITICQDSFQKGEVKDCQITQAISPFTSTEQEALQYSLSSQCKEWMKV